MSVSITRVLNKHFFSYRSGTKMKLKSKGTEKLIVINSIKIKNTQLYLFPGHIYIIQIYNWNK